MQRFPRRLDLGPPNRVLPVQHLPLQIGQVDLVIVDNHQRADTGCRHVQRGRAAQTAGAYDQGARGKQSVLSFDADRVQQDVPAVAQQLFVVHCR